MQTKPFCLDLLYNSLLKFFVLSAEFVIVRCVPRFVLPLSGPHKLLGWDPFVASEPNLVMEASYTLHQLSCFLHIHTLAVIAKGGVWIAGGDAAAGPWRGWCPRHRSLLRRMEPLMSSSPPVDLWPGTKEGVMRAPLLASRCSDPAACCFPSSPPSAREPRLEGNILRGDPPALCWFNSPCCKPNSNPSFYRGDAVC